MLLLNTRAKKVEGMFDGRITEFEPFEMKRVDDRVEGAHLLLKLMPYGVIDVKDTKLENEHLFMPTTNGVPPAVNPKLVPDFTRGLRGLRSTLDGVVGQYRSMNKDREAAKMARELPSPYVVECVKELEAIDGFLKQANAADYELVERYMSSAPEQDASQAIEAAEPRVGQTTTGSRATPASYQKKGKGKAGRTVAA